MHTCHCTDIYIPNDDGHVMNRLSPPGRASSALFLKSPIYLSLISCPIYLCDFCLNMKLRDTAARAQRPMLSMSPGMAVWHNAALRSSVAQLIVRPWQRSSDSTAPRSIWALHFFGDVWYMLGVLRLTYLALHPDLYVFDTSVHRRSGS